MGVIIKPGEPDFYADVAFERKAHGAYLDESGVELGHTMQCPHCGGHWVSRKSNQYKWKWCAECNAHTCGREKCNECNPIEKQFEKIEADARKALWT